MVYCISDIHGRMDLFEKMLEKINLQTGDMLYVIGDSIDRGGGLKVIEKIKELHDQGLATLLMGNHELVLLNNFYIHLDDRHIEMALDRIKEIQENNKADIEKINEIKGNPNILSAFELMILTGKKFNELLEMNNKKAEIRNSLVNTNIGSHTEAWETFKDLEELPVEEKREILDFIMKLSYSKELRVNVTNYLLVHGGIVTNGDNTNNDIANLFVREEFYSNKVSCEQLKRNGFQEDCVVIFGHTTTRDINIRLNHKYIAPHKIWFDNIYNDKICIDCGACYPNGQLACLRLDDMKEFYVKNEEKFITPIEKINACFNEIKVEVLKHE